MDALEVAARKSMATDVISRLPHGYDQMLGRRFEGGVELSGGEWQKVALARAYLRDAQLLILDEPTAALDARSETQVFRRFAELTCGKDSTFHFAPVLDCHAWRIASSCFKTARFLKTAPMKNSPAWAAAMRRC